MMKKWYSLLLAAAMLFSLAACGSSANVEGTPAPQESTPVVSATPAPSASAVPEATPSAAPTPTPPAETGTTETPAMTPENPEGSPSAA